jgi:hypothetical protein
MCTYQTKRCKNVSDRSLKSNTMSKDAPLGQHTSPTNRLLLLLKWKVLRYQFKDLCWWFSMKREFRNWLCLW